MDKPEIIKRMEADLITLIIKDDKPNLRSKDLAKWLGLSLSTLININLAGTIPFGFAHREHTNRYSYYNKLALWNWAFPAMGLIDKPKIIERMELKLQELLDEDDYPYISTERCAKWFGVDPVMFRRLMYAEKVPFALSSLDFGKGYGVISKLAFYNWVKCGGWNRRITE